jgi:hypothetical protein
MKNYVGMQIVAKTIVKSESYKSEVISAHINYLFLSE